MGNCSSSEERKKAEPATKIARISPSSRAIAVLLSLKVASDGSVQGQVFRTTANAIDCARKYALAATGIKNWHWHDTRHETASRLAVLGVHQEMIGQMIGHKSTQMTKDYQHFLQAELVKAVK
mgnify:CR=1 FL=1